MFAAASASAALSATSPSTLNANSDLLQSFRNVVTSIAQKNGLNDVKVPQIAPAGLSAQQLKGAQEASKFNFASLMERTLQAVMHPLRTIRARQESSLKKGCEGGDQAACAKLESMKLMQENHIGKVGLPSDGIVSEAMGHKTMSLAEIAELLKSGKMDAKQLAEALKDNKLLADKDVKAFVDSIKPNDLNNLTEAGLTKLLNDSQLLKHDLAPGAQLAVNDGTLRMALPEEKRTLTASNSDVGAGVPNPKGFDSVDTFNNAVTGSWLDGQPIADASKSLKDNFEPEAGEVRGDESLPGGGSSTSSPSRQASSAGGATPNSGSPETSSGGGNQAHTNGGTTPSDSSVSTPVANNPTTPNANSNPNQAAANNNAPASGNNSAVNNPSTTPEQTGSNGQQAASNEQPTPESSTDNTPSGGETAAVASPQEEKEFWQGQLDDLNRVGACTDASGKQLPADINPCVGPQTQIANIDRQNSEVANNGGTGTHPSVGARPVTPGETGGHSSSGDFSNGNGSHAGGPIVSPTKPGGRKPTSDKWEPWAPTFCSKFQEDSNTGGLTSSSQKAAAKMLKEIVALGKEVRQSPGEKMGIYAGDKSGTIFKNPCTNDDSTKTLFMTRLANRAAGAEPPMAGPTSINDSRVAEYKGLYCWENRVRSTLGNHRSQSYSDGSSHFDMPWVQEIFACKGERESGEMLLALEQALRPLAQKCGLRSASVFGEEEPVMDESKQKRSMRDVILGYADGVGGKQRAMHDHMAQALMREPKRAPASAVPLVVSEIDRGNGERLHALFGKTLFGKGSSQDLNLVGDLSDCRTVESTYATIAGILINENFKAKPARAPLEKPMTELHVEAKIVPDQNTKSGLRFEMNTKAQLYQQGH